MIGFDGVTPVSHSPERPKGMEHFAEGGCPTELPYWAPVGWRLVSLQPAWGSGADPFVIYDRYDHMLHIFDQEYPPSYLEVMQVCERLLDK